jgi:serine/threonine-protein kinase
MARKSTVRDDGSAVPVPDWLEELPSLEGREVGDLVFIREITRGGMAVIYEAYQKNLRRRVAVKLLPPASVKDEFKRRIFDREAEGVANLQHPNVVQIFSIGQFEGMRYFVMELIRGKTLEEMLEHRRRRPAQSQRVMMEEEACRIIEPALEALSYAHRQGIVHRDIKPSNIMVDHTGRVFLTDFGVLKMMTDDEGAERVMAGTPAYMAPEQSRGEAVDARADLYAVGLLLLEMLTGMPCVEGVKATDMLLRAQQPQEEGEWHAPISSAMARVICKATQPDPAERYQTAEEMLQAMREPRAVAGAAAVPVSASASADSGEGESFVSQYRMALAVVVILATACIALAFGLAHLLLRMKS